MSQLFNKPCLIIDDDDASIARVTEVLSDCGFNEISSAASGDMGWDLLDSAETPYAFVVLDWQMVNSGLSGLAVFNRIRQHPNYHDVPVLVLSGLLKQQDFRIVQEFPLARLVEKPIQKIQLESRAKSLIAEKEWYDKSESSILAKLKAVKKDPKKVLELVQSILKDAPHPVPMVLMISKILIESEEHLKTCEETLKTLVKFDKNSIGALNELAKVLHLQGRHQDALRVVSRAVQMSPENINRLCLLGEIKLNLKDPENARVAFKQALKIDGDDSVAQSGFTVAENMQELMQSSDFTQVPRTFASLMNTMGIAFVRNGEFERGVTQYNSAMAFLRSDDDTARVAFNLGLGYLRWGQKKDAIEWFKKSRTISKGRFLRSGELLMRLDPNWMENQNEIKPTADMTMPIDSDSVMPTEFSDIEEADLYELADQTAEENDLQLLTGLDSSDGSSLEPGADQEDFLNLEDLDLFD